MFGVPGPKPECKAGEPARSGSGLAVPLGTGAVSPLGPHGVEDGRGGRRPLWLNRAAGSQRLRPVWGRRAGARLDWTVSPVPLCFREKFVGSDLLCQQEQEEALGTGVHLPGAAFGSKRKAGARAKAGRGPCQSWLHLWGF